MVTALLGKKIGMTQVFEKDGTAVPATVLQVGPCRVMQLKSPQTDGYFAVQLGFEEKKRKRATKPEIGHAKKAGVEPARFVREVRLQSQPDMQLGQVLTVGILKDAETVHVTGTSKGKGFAGVVRRHHFHGMGDSHGVSKVHKAPGSIGSSTTLSRVMKGVRMAGHMGCRRSTVENLRVVSIMEEDNLLIVNGAVPGANGGYVVVRIGATRGAK